MTEACLIIITAYKPTHSIKPTNATKMGRYRNPFVNLSNQKSHKHVNNVSWAKSILASLLARSLCIRVCVSVKFNKRYLHFKCE